MMAAPHRKPVKQPDIDAYKTKVRNDCLRRVRENRDRLLWTNRTAGGTALLRQIHEVSRFDAGSVAPTAPLPAVHTVDGADGCAGRSVPLSSSFEGRDGTAGAACPELEPGGDVVLSALSETEYEALLSAMLHELHGERGDEPMEYDEGRRPDDDDGWAGDDGQGDEPPASPPEDAPDAALDDGGDPVRCPLCQRRYLQASRVAFTCCCGFTLPAGRDGLTLGLLGRRLRECHAGHRLRGCAAPPCFRVEDRWGAPPTLYLSCAACACLECVL